MITDWDDAYDNGGHIDDAAGYPPRWATAAAAFRLKRPPREIAYGKSDREKVDIFLPDSAPKGVFVFVHGGYWMKFGRRDWSHLAGAALARGWAAALPEYPLCPQARISQITACLARACETAAMHAAGPVILAGHSAGGHLVSRMLCEDGPKALIPRIKTVCSISGLHDLRPLLRTRMNAALRLDAAEAAAESPALLAPASQSEAQLICWAGARERPEFMRQNRLLANIWRGLGVATEAVETPERHHFDVIDGLADPDSALAARLFGGG